MTVIERETVDANLIEYYRLASAEKLQFRGMSILNHWDLIGLLIRSVEAKTVLDYGSGLGQAYDEPYSIHRTWGIAKPTLYDPGVIGLEQKPDGVFDVVIVSDVMEHVPERLVDNVLEEVFGYATKAVWLSVCCRKAKKKFPDGTNLHVTIKPEEWWRERVKLHSDGLRYELIFTP